MVRVAGLSAPDRSPLQPRKLASGSGSAVAVTMEPAGYGPFGGLSDTLPGPLEAVLTVKSCVKLALTAVSAFTVSVSGFALPESAPSQPLNTALAPGTAISVTSVPAV